MIRPFLTILLPVLVLAPLAVFAQESSVPQSFVPLTSLPGVQEFQESRSITDFLNNLYKICIGVAAALAVFQIMHAGIKFMTNRGSISENEQARSLLQGAVFGLILVLSPVIVFGIINPRILELNFDTRKLGTSFDGDIAVETGGGDSEEIDPNAPYVEKYFFRYFYAESNEAALEHYRSFCSPANQPYFDMAGAGNQIPDSLRHLIEDYELEQVDDEECNEGDERCVNNVRYVGRCEATSNDFNTYRIDGSGVWAAVPGESARIEREFKSGCARDQGRVVEKRDAIQIVPCLPATMTAIMEETGAEYADITCRQIRLMCQQPTR